MKSIAFLHAHLALAVLAVFLFTSCAFQDGDFSAAKTEQVSISLPDYPANRPRLTSWLFVYEKNGEIKTTILAKDTKSVLIVVEKNRFAPMLLFPLNTDRFFKPAGCIYPFSCEATWDSGFGAQVLFDLLTKPNSQYTATELRSFCERFNWARFQTEVADLCANNSLFNPWEMDVEKIMTSLVAGKFAKNKLKTAAKPVTVGGAGRGVSGSYFQAYIPATVIETESGEFSFRYFAAADNTVFDGESIFLVCPPIHPGTTGLTNYQLTRMP